MPRDRWKCRIDGGYAARLKSQSKFTGTCGIWEQKLKITRTEKY